MVELSSTKRMGRRCVTSPPRASGRSVPMDSQFTKCRVSHCDRSVHGHGLCNKHYQRWRKSGDPLKVQWRRNPTPQPYEADPSKAKRFWSFVDTSGECWIWLRSTPNTRYGWFADTHAHRYSYALHHGPIPKGNLIQHTCDNPLCVNPEHLRLGTYESNVVDMIRKGRAPNMKISDEDVLSLRAEFDNGVGNVSFLARKYGISRRRVIAILNGDARKHLL